MMSERSDSFGYLSPFFVPNFWISVKMKRWSSCKQLLQMLAAVGLALLGDGPRVAEVLVDLVVEVVPVGDDEERPVAGHLPQHLLREEDHRKALAAPLRVPEDAQPALVGLDLLQSGDGVVHAEELVVLGDDLDQSALGVVEDGEVLHQVEEPALLACPPDQGFQRDDALARLRC